MNKEARVACLPSLFALPVAGFAFARGLGAIPHIALAQSTGNVDPTQGLSWEPGAISHGHPA